MKVLCPCDLSLSFEHLEGIRRLKRPQPKAASEVPEAAVQEQIARTNLDDFHCSYFSLCYYGRGIVDAGPAALNLMDVILNLVELTV